MARVTVPYSSRTGGTTSDSDTAPLRYHSGVGWRRLTGAAHPASPPPGSRRRSLLATSPAIRRRGVGCSRDERGSHRASAQTLAGPPCPPSLTSPSPAVSVSLDARLILTSA